MVKNKDLATDAPLAVVSPTKGTKVDTTQGNIVTVDFQAGNVVKVVSNKKDAESHFKTLEKAKFAYLKKMRQTLSKDAYMAVLEAIVSIQAGRTLSPSLLPYLTDYFNLF